MNLKFLLVDRTVQELIGIRWYIQTYLAGIHTIEFATNATDAITKLQTFEPDILLLNLEVLPDTREASIYHALQRANCHTFATASDSLYQSAVKAVDIHAKALWTKPIDLEKFLLKITSLPPIQRESIHYDSFYFELFQRDTMTEKVFILIEPENKSHVSSLFCWLNESITFVHAEIYPLSSWIICLLPAETVEKDARMIAKQSPYSVNVCIVDEVLSVQESYKVAKRRLDQRFYEGFGHVLHASKQVKLSTFDPLLSPSQQKLLLNSLETQNIDAFTQIFQPLRHHYFEQEDVRVHLTSIVAQIRRFMISYHLVEDKSLEEDYHRLYRIIIEHPILYKILEEITQFTSELMKAVYTIQQQQSTSYVTQAKNYIDKNYASNEISLQTVSRVLGINANYLSTLFSKEAGISLSKYLQKVRINRSTVLLSASEYTIQEIAYYCGFEDANYFSKCFKKVMGVTPKQYRQLHTYDTVSSD